MGLDQVTAEYSREFITQHTGHSVKLSVVSMVDFKYSASIEDGIVVGEELLTETPISDFGFYLHCHDCGVEQEINMSDVDYE